MISFRVKLILLFPPTRSWSERKFKGRLL